MGFVSEAVNEPLHEYVALTAARRAQLSRDVSSFVRIGGPSRIRTYDFHRVKVALYR